MAWQDRPYYRDRSTGGGGNPLTWLLTGSVPLFTAFGIRVRAHASLVVIAALLLLFGWGPGSGAIDRIHSVTVLFLVILLHEFGHCFAARWTGGSAEEILMTPLGGLAFAMARRRPLPTFITVAGGPAVNVLICLFCAAGLYLIHGWFPLGPLSFGEIHDASPGWFQISSYLFWLYTISYALLVFNMLPVFPLDGGQMLQSILWKPIGYYKSMMLALNVGIVGSILMIMAGIASIGAFYCGMLLAIIGVNCLLNCIQMRAMMKAEGPWAFSDEQSFDYGRAPREEHRRKKLNPRLYKKVRRSEAQERAEQEHIDAILAKVSAYGMQSLTWLEKRALRKATERQRQRDLELSQQRKF